VEAVEVSLPEEIDVEGTATAEVEVRDRRGNLLVRPVEWRSSNLGVATVDGSGRVRGVSEGSATITGTSEGVSGSALVRVRACVSAPPPLSEAPFRVSGSIARASGVAVDVVLNPILVDGRPVTGLVEENFLVVEDDCRRPFTVTTSEGAIGIDLVFIQDLSGSMGGAITGVRNSVISFADQLASRGLDIRLGSVGYSGPSLIPSTPAGSISEYLGPVQDLTDPATFQTHVTDQWVASGGGDAPENGLEAVEYAHQNLSWRPGATRVMILITDISLHWSGSICGCSDQTIESIAELIGGSTVVHAVAPADPFTRTYSGGLDPWLLAEATGGAQLALGAGGVVDLNALEIESVLAETIRLTFQSATTENVPHDLRVRVTLPDGAASELVAEGVRYDPLEAELRAARFPTR
jgi:Bacterial Ig-like domain (group 2)